jgi:hypothetical protein
MRRLPGFPLLLAAFLFLLIPKSAEPNASDRLPIVEALSWVRNLPHDDLAEFDYIMTARVRLLLFWIGKDDVGGGYIRGGVSKTDPHQELFQVLFGSDPEKAPRAINRWGAGTEVVWHKDSVDSSVDSEVVRSAFFGFMKSSKGKSVSEMQQELSKEKDKGEHQFTGILSRVEPGHAVSLVVPLASDQDFNLRQYEQAEPLIFEKLTSSDKSVRTLPESAVCSRASAFLGTVSELLDAALAGKKGPLSLCYIHDAQVNTLTLQNVQPVAKLVVKLNSAKGGVLSNQTYEHLLQVEFVSVHQATGKQVSFTILVGTTGDLRGVPVQIRYQPNWWFQVVLNLRSEARAPTTLASSK